MSDVKLLSKRWWFVMVTQGMVIIGSILLAFGIDAWWSEVQERDAAEELAAGLIVDLESTLDDLRGRLRSHRRRESAALELREQLRQPVPAISADSVDALLLRSIAFDRQTPVLHSYEQLITTGLLRLLEEGVRDALARWIASLETSQVYGERDFLDLRQNLLFPFWTGPLISFEETMTKYGEWGVGLGEVRFRHEWEALRESRELTDILVLTATLSQSLILQQSRQETALLELIDLLRDSYGPV